MLLGVDIGNTNICFGLFKGNRLFKKSYIPTEAKWSTGDLIKIIGNNKISDIIVCSVVPKSTLLLEKKLQKLFGKRPIIIGKDLKVPMKNLYRKPRQVGQDRLVNAYAGIKLYNAPLIVVDFGTAVTFDVVSKDREYLGGMILPGLNLSLRALSEHTALLPRIDLTRPREFIGRDTKNSMLSGIIYGFAALVDDLIVKIKEKIGKSALVICTGGDADFINSYCRGIDRVDKDLTLKGLNFIYRGRKS
jgi:type III pantothenate kinase